MMALLAGAQLASHLLQLTEGSDRLLPEVYPREPHVGRFNLTSEAARVMLQAADTHLGAMSVPYALSIHEDYLKTCLAMLERAGRCSMGTADRLKLHAQHAEVERATAGRFGADSLAQLGHAAPDAELHYPQWWPGKSVPGGQDRRLDVDNRDGLVTPGEAQPSWAPRGRPGRVCARRADPGAGRDQGVGSASKSAPAASLPREQWADMVVDDLVDSDPHVLRAPDRLRRARGLARFHYQDLGLTSSELAAALARR